MATMQAHASMSSLGRSISEPTLNLGSPRTKAAMKVLGVLPSEVRQKDIGSYGNNEAKHRLFEQKRKNLIEEVRKKAASAPDASGRDIGIDGLTRDERNALFMEQVARAEKESMARMAKIAKDDVQNVVIQELVTKVIAKRSAHRQEEAHKRMEALLKSRDDDLQARKKAAEKKQDKIRDVLAKADQRKMEHSLEMQETLRKNNERAEAQIQAIADARLGGRQANQERFEQIWKRQEDFAQSLFDGRKAHYAEFCDKMDRKTQMLEDRLAARLSHAEEIAAKQQKCMDNVKEYQRQKQEDAETRYLQSLAHHKECADKRASDRDTAVKNYSTRNLKRKQGHEARYDRIQKEINQENAKKTEEFEKRMDEFERTRATAKAAASAQLQHFFDHRDHMVELTQTNRQRLRRAHHHAVQEQLAKLSMMREKVQVLQNAKSEADKRRMTVMSKCAVEKMHLNDRIDRVKNSKDPEKMQRMLEDLGPDADAVERINELLKELGMDVIGVTKEEEEGK